MQYFFLLFFYNFYVMWNSVAIKSFAHFHILTAGNLLGGLELYQDVTESKMYLYFQLECDNIIITK